MTPQDLPDPSEIILQTEIDSPYKIETQLESAAKKLEQIIGKINEQEANQVMVSYASKGKIEHDIVQLGLLHKLLVDSKSSAVCYRDITTTVRDNYTTIFNTLSSLVSEKMYQINPSAVNQIFWFANESLKNSLSRVDGLIYNLLRSLSVYEVTPDISPQIILGYSQSLAEIISNNMKYFLNHPHLVRDTVTILLTIIPNHHYSSAQLHMPLMNKEINLCTYLLTEKFDECALIGKELIRLLKIVANIAGFNQIWQTLITNPKALSPNIQSIFSILSKPTSKHLVMTVVSPKVDTNIQFIVKQIAEQLAEGRNSEDYFYYFQWFDKKIIAANYDMNILKPNIIRYVILSTTPLNSANDSESFPNYDEHLLEAKATIIEWILNISHSPMESANVKLALMYEFLTFSQFQSMNCEEVVNNYAKIVLSPSHTELWCTWKIIHYLSKKNGKLVEQIVAFLPTLTSQFFLQFKDIFLINVQTAVISCLKRLKIPQFESFVAQLVSQANLAHQNRTIEHPQAANEPFAHVSEPETVLNDPSPENINPLPVQQQISNPNEKRSDPSLPRSESQSKIMKIETSESDENFPSSKPGRKANTPNSSKSNSKKEESLSISLKDIEQPLQGYITAAMKKSKEWIEMTDILNKIIDTLISETMSSEKRDKIIKIIAKSLFSQLQNDINIFFKNFNKKIYLMKNGQLNFDAMFSCPVFAIIKHLKIQDSKYEPIWHLVFSISELLPIINFMVLFFDVCESYVESVKTRKLKTKAENLSTFSFEDSVYVKFSVRWSKKPIEDSLYADLELCSLVSHKLFCHIIGNIYKLFQQRMTEESRFIHLVCGTIDADQLKQLTYEIAAEQVNLIPKEDIVDIIDDSLEWETIEQIFFWQLLLAHSLNLNQIWQIIPDLEWNAHGEAINAIVSLLKHSSPKLSIMKMLFARQNKGSIDKFVVLILEQWRQTYAQDVLMHLTNYLNFLLTNSRVEFRNISLTLDQMSLLFEHNQCQYIFDSESILESLSNIKKMINNLTEDQQNFLKKIEEKRSGVKNGRNNSVEYVIE